MKNSIWMKGGLPLIIILLAIVIAAVMITSRKPPEQQPVETKDFLVDASPVNREPVQFTVASQGNVLPKHQTNISAQVSGRVASLADVFVVGGMFKEGDVLVILEQDDYHTELKLAEAELAQATAALEEEKARGKVAAAEWQSVNSVVPPELGLRKPQLLKEQANVKAAEAKLERAKRNLARTEIRAPYNGIVVERNIDLGQFVSTGAVVGEIYATDVAEVRLPITDSDLAFIDLSASVKSAGNVALKAKVAGKLRHWTADLVRTEGVLDRGNRVIYAIAQVEDPYRNSSTSEDGAPLRFGQFVEASIAGNENRNLFVLPRNVLRLDNTVLTVNDKRKLVIKPVEVVRSNAQNVYISGGLEAGELVIMSAVPNPYEGMKVRLPGDEVPTAQASNDKAKDGEAIHTDEANP
ncbi:efflux RND transporter periplasmic adaptor subunit [Alteromonas pelagimontana]|uniref:Efflux RND transporter periplasmic adaptor subunit n=1 Tax=Alteromonas pelagimontana TaxID=1858656 RepID=A0A6M4M856_9ALTE|nr:efflux RND transporter periplasmic adaptor subunit [Alteromonas pelagimontana]QJR79414.1 efflux RND transporter periplasmic adaptor subunit [Alteromonas pelagimontana]